MLVKKSVAKLTKDDLLWMKIIIRDLRGKKISADKQIAIEIITEAQVKRGELPDPDVENIVNEELIAWWKALKNVIPSRKSSVGTLKHTSLCIVEREIERRGLSF